MAESLNTILRKGERALDNGDTLVALLQFETALKQEPRPGIKSKLAYCLAKERRQFQKALGLCREALESEPDNPDHYYQLARIYITAGQKHNAIKSLRKGLKFRRHQPSIDELARIGYRKTPVFSSLPREHVLNRCAGILFTKLGTR